MNNVFLWILELRSASARAQGRRGRFTATGEAQLVKSDAAGGPTPAGPTANGIQGAIGFPWPWGYPKMGGFQGKIPFDNCGGFLK